MTLILAAVIVVIMAVIGIFAAEVQDETMADNPVALACVLVALPFIWVACFFVALWQLARSPFTEDS